RQEERRVTSFPSEPMRVLYGDLDLTDHPYIFDRDASFGAGENVYEALAGMLADGETVTSDRTSNREVSFVVWVEGQSLGQVEGPGAALDVEADRQRSELTVYPGNGGTPFVLETFRASIEPDRTDARESASMRRFVVTAPARPFVRSLEGTLSPVFASPPPPVAPVVVTVDDCNSTSGWTAYPAPVAHASGYVYNSTWAEGGSQRYASLTRAGAVDMTTTPHLIVEWHRAKRDWTPIWPPPVLNATALTGPPPDRFWLTPVQTVILDKMWAQ